MADIASLGIQVTTTGVQQAGTDLDNLAEKGKRAADSADKTGNAWRKAASEISNNTGSIISQLQALNSTQSQSLTAALGTNSALEKLTAQLASLKSGFSDVNTQGAAAAKSVAAVGESADETTVRIRAMVAASLEQMNAQTAALASTERTAGAQAAVAAGYGKSLASQNKAMAATTALVAEEEKLNTAAAKTAGLAAQRAELAKLVGQITPAVSALEKLDAQQAKLNAFKKAGILGAEDFTALSGAIDSSRAKISEAGKAVEHFTLNNSLARRELGYLAKDLALGNYGRFTQSALTLANASGIMRLAFSGIGLAVGAVVGSLALAVVAFAKGEGETTAFNKALILTGNYAATTSDQLSTLSKSLSGTYASQHEAAGALAEVAATGRFAGTQISLVTTAALELQKTTGQAVAETVKQFVALADDPVKAITKLNETQHFLTDAVYEQIKALDDQGKATQAADLAERTYAESIGARTSMIQKDLGLIEQAWNGITSATKAAVSAAMDVGRAETSQHKFDVLEENRTAAKGLVDRGMGGDEFLGSTAKKYYDEATSKLSKLQDDYVNGQKDASKKAGVQQANDLAISLSQEATKYESAESKRAKEIAKAHSQANEAISKLNTESDATLIAQIRKNEAAVVAGVDSREKKPKKAAAEKADPFNSLNGLVQGAQVFDAGVGLSKSNDEQVKKILAIVDAGAKLIEKGKDVAKTQALVATGVAAVNEGYAKQAAILKSENLTAMAQYQASLDRENQALQKQVDARLASITMGAKEAQQELQLADIRIKSADKLTDLQLKRDAIKAKGGDTSVFDANINALQANTDKQIHIVKKGFIDMDAEQANWLNGAKTAFTNFADDGANVAKHTDTLFTSTFNNLNSAIANFAVTGKLSFNSLFQSFLTGLIEIELKAQESKILNAAGLGGGAPGAGGSGSSTFTSILSGVIGLFNKGSIPATGATPIPMDQITLNAKGGAYNSPSLSAFSGSIVNKPTTFAFASGAGLMGEAGPEAILPLRRGQDGKLGVAMDTAGGRGGAVSIHQQIVVQGTVNRRTAQQIAQASAKEQRIAQARN